MAAVKAYMGGLRNRPVWEDKGEGKEGQFGPNPRNSDRIRAAYQLSDWNFMQKQSKL
jgi:hypothetical protein